MLFAHLFIVQLTLLLTHYRIKNISEGNALETMTLDSKTLIIKSDNETDLPEIIDFITQKDRNKNINSFLNFASQNRIEMNDYKFNREECYGR